MLSSVLQNVETLEAVTTVFLAVATLLGAYLVVDTVVETVRLFRE